MKKKEKVVNISDLQRKLLNNPNRYSYERNIQIDPFIDFDLENDVAMVDKVKKLGKKNFLE